MTATTTDSAVTSEAVEGPSTSPQDAAPTPLVEEELLVEDVSIDGMCGVY
ncbi:MAG TPA: mycofactocin precursor MftA [Acidimicrobiales bacterium]